MSLKNKNILLGVCGGIAAYKIPLLIRLLKKQGANVRVVVTRAATRFVTELTLSTLSQEPVYQDIFPDCSSTDEWTRHIALGEWADAYVIAPATANTIAKLASGICNDMLSASFITLRPHKPKLLFPAMDGEMFDSASVQRNLTWLSEQGCIVINPESGQLASGQCGTGRMPEPETITDVIEQAVTNTQHDSVLRGKSVVITAGPTREKIDDVRFISNYSSGKMGFALARAAVAKGAEVTLITGPVQLHTPEGVTRLNVESSEEMHNAVSEHHTSCDIFIAAAAVADYRPVEAVSGKLKKEHETMEISLVKNPDILAGFSEQKKAHQLAIGFSLETAGNLHHAKTKLQQKKLDLIAYNTFDGKTSGFEVDTNVLTLIDRNLSIEELPLLSKQKAAEKMLDAIEKLLNSRE